jgi:hypothetical protein
MPTFRTLHEFLSVHGDAVIERWQRRVQERPGAETSTALSWWMPCRRS